MKNNKGFTLVETLALISIIAILITISLPSVIGSLNESRKQTFSDECKKVYELSEESYVSDSKYSQDIKEYGKCNDCNFKALNLSSNIDYYVKYDEDGRVIKFYVTDGIYQYGYEGSGLLISEINDIKKVSELESSKIVNISNMFNSSK